MNIQEIREKMCDSYCMYPEEYMSYYHDPDDAMTAMHNEVCIGCPLNLLEEPGCKDCKYYAENCGISQNDCLLGGSDD